MGHIAQNRKKMGKMTIVTVLFLVVILSAQTGCATTGRKGSSIIPSREATEIWHSYEIQPNYHYYYSGPNSQPNFIIGIDDKYQFTSKLWKPVDLTPETRRSDTGNAQELVQLHPSAGGIQPGPIWRFYYRSQRRTAWPLVFGARLADSGIGKHQRKQSGFRHSSGPIDTGSTGPEIFY
jgi:hypothetical protein